MAQFEDDDDENELSEELARGSELCKQIVEHFINMGGAGTMNQFVEYDGRGYDVTISVEGTYPNFKKP